MAGAAKQKPKAATETCIDLFTIFADDIMQKARDSMVVVADTEWKERSERVREVLMDMVEDPVNLVNYVEGNDEDLREAKRTAIEELKRDFWRKNLLMSVGLTLAVLIVGFGIIFQTGK